RMLKTNTSKRRGALAVSTGLYGLRPDPHDARALATAADAGVYPTARPAAVVLSNSRPRVVTRCIYEGSRKRQVSLFSLQANSKTNEGGNRPDPDAQFCHKNQSITAALPAH